MTQVNRWIGIALKASHSCGRGAQQGHERRQGESGGEEGDVTELDDLSNP